MDKLICQCGCKSVIPFKKHHIKSPPVSAELAKANNDGKKVVLDLNLKGDNADKAAGIFLMAGSDVTLHIEPAQTSLLEGDKPKNDHEGVEYAVDVTTGNVLSYNDRKKAEKEAAAVEEPGKKEEVEFSETNKDEFGDEDDLEPVADDDVPFL